MYFVEYLDLRKMRQPEDLDDWNNKESGELYPVNIIGIIVANKIVGVSNKSNPKHFVNG